MIGLIGLGAMGSGMASTPLRKLCSLKVYEIDPGRLQPAVRAGAVAAESVADFAGSCDTVLLSLPKSHVTVESIEEQVKAAASEGTVIIDLGTTVVRETRHDNMKRPYPPFWSSLMGELEENV